MNIFKRSLAMFLVLCMLVGITPINAFADNKADNTEVVQTEVEETNKKAVNDFIKVFHLDCGRKYFTVDQVKELIDALSNAGFSHMELAIGNDGLRLLLDDMSISANGTTYASETIKNGIKSGNKNYSHSGEWSQSEMDTIIAYAKTKGIEIIPLVNNPGHMDSILAAMKACGIDGYYESSARTVDLENAKAVAFTQALVMKYAQYFANKGCKYFNIGADEYANDYHTSDSTGMGFGYLVSKNKYGNFVTYVNTLVEDICDLGMTPIAFNDGIYYNSTTTQGTFDNRLIVAAWSGGWGGIKPAKTTFLVQKGHKILNTNERWYYVPSASSGYTYNNALNNAKSVSVTTVTDNTGAASMGAMQCVWFDYPNVNYETYKSNVMTLIKTLADSNPTYFTGPNEPVEPETPEVPENVTKTDKETNVAVTAPGLTGLAITEVQAPVVEGAAQNKVLAWNMTPTTADSNYVGEAEVSVPVPASWTNVRGGVLASDNGKEVMDIKGKLENGVFTFTVPHFSTVVTYEVEAVAMEPDVTVNLTVGQTSQTYTDNSGYYTVAEGLDKSIATATLGGNAGSAATVKYTEADVSCNDLISSNSTSWKATGYYYKNGENYYPLYAKRSSQWQFLSTRYTYTWGYSVTETTIEQIGNTQSTTDTKSKPSIPVYTKSGVEAVPAKTTVSFTGVSAGTTYATVGATVYKIVVNKKTESATLSIGDNITYTDKSKNVPVVENSAIATATINNGVLTITAKAEGTTKVITDNVEYTIKVIPFNPDTVSKVPVYFWITSQRIHDAQDRTEMEISVSDAGVYSVEGAKLTGLIPFTGVNPQNDENKIHNLWQVRLQHAGAQQTEGGSDDKTSVGEQVEYIRYYNSKWQVKDTSGTWLDVAETDQLTAYYLMKSPLTDEVDSLVKDWGFQYKDGETKWDYFSSNSYCAVSAQVIYEDGSMNPDTKENKSDTPLIDTTVFFNFWSKGQDNHTSDRDIGYFLPQFNDQYEIYKITTMHGSCSVTYRNGNATAASVNYGNPDPNDEEEVIVWQMGDGTPELIGKDGDDALQWRNSKDAILIRIYLRAKVTEDSLNVIYYDEKFGDELYSYNISVDAGVNFTNDITPKPGAFAGNAERIDVTNCTIQNKNDVTQYLQTDLTKVPEAKGKYNSELYAYTGSEISEDGKTLYLYYNINTNVLKPTYVVDFGLPITFSLSDVTNTPDLAKTVTASARYGTVDYNSTTKMFTYTPTTILQNIDVLSINILFDKEESVSTTNVGVTPATTVFYEESFVDYDTNWNVPNAPTKMQATEVLGKSSYYGYDAAYSKDNAGSNSTYAESKATGAAATFTFTGTGFELYANSKPASGYVTVYSQGELSKLYMINTQLNGGTTGATNQQQGDTYYSLPIISETDLPHGTYTVQIKQTNGEKPVYLDGVRIVNTIDETEKTPKESIYYDDEEDKPVFHELRDYVLNAIGVENLEESDYISSGNRDTLVSAVTDMAGQVYNALGEGEKAVLINKEKTTFTQDQAQDLLDNGPKNEVYLYPGQTLAFSVDTNRVMQLGLKAPTGSAQFKLMVDDKELELDSLSTTVDMFYKLAEKGGTTHTVSITVNEGMLSVTDLKICDDPNATFNELTQEDIENVLLNVFNLNEKEEEPELSMADAHLNIALVDYTGKTIANTELTSNGELGTDASFTADAIKDAIAVSLPTGYAVVNLDAIVDQIVVHGESANIKVQVGKVATLVVTYVKEVTVKNGKKNNKKEEVVGTVTLTKVQTSKDKSYTFSVSEIEKAAPAGFKAKKVSKTKVDFGKTKEITVKNKK